MYPERQSDFAHSTVGKSTCERVEIQYQQNNANTSQHGVLVAVRVCTRTGMYGDIKVRVGNRTRAVSLGEVVGGAEQAAVVLLVERTVQAAVRTATCSVARAALTLRLRGAAHRQVRRRLVLPQAGREQGALGEQSTSRVQCALRVRRLVRGDGDADVNATRRCSGWLELRWRLLARLPEQAEHAHFATVDTNIVRNKLFQHLLKTK